jgi:hypothetical protein
MSDPLQEGGVLARLPSGFGEERQGDRGHAIDRVGLDILPTVADRIAKGRRIVADPPDVGHSPAGRDQAMLASQVDLVKHPAALGVRAVLEIGHAGSLRVQVVGVGELPAEKARHGPSSSSV